MADNRLPNMAGHGGMQHSTAFNPLMNMRMGSVAQPMYAAGGQQQFTSGMQFYPVQGMSPAMMGNMPGMVTTMYPMQSVRPPGGPSLPYTPHLATQLNHKARLSPGGSKASLKPKTEKERYFEEQQKRLRMFHKPGTQVTDANKLIDNLFGKTEKRESDYGPGSGAGTATSQKPGFLHSAISSSTPGHQEDDEDGFGDFLGGPATSVTPLPGISTTCSLTSSVIQSPSAASPPQRNADLSQQLSNVLPSSTQLAEKKDLMSMMMECSDLNAPQKARGFHKPSLIEVQKSGVHPGMKTTEVHHESDHARRWDNTQDLEGLFIVESKAKAASPRKRHPPHSPTTPTGPPALHSSHLEMMTPAAGVHPVGSSGFVGMTEGGGGSRRLPDWCYDSGQNLPVVYQQVLEATSEGGDNIITERLYPILLMSGLPRELLGQLWSMANTLTPGHLTRTELWILLAFVALVQNNYEVTSSAILRRCPQAPVPFLGQAGKQVGTAAPPTSVQASHVAASPECHVDSVDVGYPGRLFNSTHAVTSAQQSPPSPPQIAASSAVPAATSAAVLPTSDADDDFNDFQAAPTPDVRLPVIPPPAAASKTTVTTAEDSYGEFIGGNSSSASEQSLSVVPKGDEDKLYNNGEMTADEQYHSNVRNFFCSSDSSTATDSPSPRKTRHTTPNSLDDDDLTDGHDSLSQVSTSEQSESEDIRAFENYVEELNRKKDFKTPSINPLHGAFPRSAMAGQGSPQRLSSGITSANPRGVTSPPALNIPIPKPPSNNSTVPTLPVGSQQQATPASVTGKVDDDDDFADFKSAVGTDSHVVLGNESKKAASSDEMILMGEEDKYSALRDVSGNVPSLFETQAEEAPSTFTASGAQQDADAEDWADFSAAVNSSPASAQPAVAQQSVNAVQRLPSGTSTTQSAGEVPGDETSGAEDWANFTSATETEPASGSTIPPGTGTVVGAPLSTASNSQGEFSSAISAGHRNLVGLKIASHGGNNENDDDWADFTSAKSSSESPTSAEYTGWGVDSGNSVSFSVESEVRQLSVSDVTATSSEVFTGINQSAVLTVKKQNLGTSEIMNVFRVRNDPVTMSSYELPKHQADHHTPSHKHHHDSVHRKYRSRSGSKESQRPHSADDDFGGGPPPLDSVGDDEDEPEFSRGYDLDDIVHQPVPTTVCTPFGYSHHLPGYGRSAFTPVMRTSKAVDHPIPATESRSHSLSPDSGETDSLSNQVLSLPEDSQSVSSLDLPVSKLSLGDIQRDSDTGGTDSQSVSSMEFGGMEGGGGTEMGVSESKSLDSLDLRTADLDEEGERTRVAGLSQQGCPPLPGLTGQVPILGDRYNLDGQVEGSERYAYEWERCLASSCQHINNANNIFNTISSSSVCNEVLKSPQGTDYVLGLIEIYRMVCRIMTALPTTAVSSPSIEQSLKQIDLAWNNLSAFLVGASLLPEEATLVFSDAVLKPDSPSAQFKACGVCLLDVDSFVENTDTAKLAYGGRQYHAACANFWVNCVDTLLPALKLPELL